MIRKDNFGIDVTKLRPLSKEEAERIYKLLNRHFPGDSKAEAKRKAMLDRRIEAALEATDHVR